MAPYGHSSFANAFIHSIGTDSLPCAGPCALAGDRAMSKADTPVPALTHRSQILELGMGWGHPMSAQRAAPRP